MWAAPPLCLSEVRNVLLRYVRSGSLSLAAALGLVERADQLLAPYRLEVDSAAILRMAHAAGLSAYDAEYAALAEALEVPLVTEDRAIRAVRGLAIMTPTEFLAKP